MLTPPEWDTLPEAVTFFIYLSDVSRDRDEPLLNRPNVHQSLMGAFLLYSFINVALSTI